MTIHSPRAKIVATLGPASRSEDVLRALIESGLDVARVNFSHGSYEEHAATIALVRRLADEAKRPIAILADLQGPRIRIGDIATPVTVVPGQDITLAPEGEPRA